MTKHLKVINFIKTIRDSHPHMEYVYTNGSCINFFCILKQVFPNAKPWFNIDHIITEIDGKFYDITGSVSNKGYAPYTTHYSKRGTSKSFSQMYNTIPDINMKTINDVELHVTQNGSCITNEVVINGQSLLKECSEDAQGLEYIMLYKVQNYIKALKKIKGMLQNSIEECNEREISNQLNISSFTELTHDIITDQNSYLKKMDLTLNDQVIFRAIRHIPNGYASDTLEDYFHKNLEDIHYKLGKYLYGGENSDEEA